MNLRDAVLFLLPLAERDAETLVAAWSAAPDGDEAKIFAIAQLAKVQAIRKQVYDCLGCAREHGK